MSTDPVSSGRGRQRAHTQLVALGCGGADTLVLSTVDLLSRNLTLVSVVDFLCGPFPHSEGVICFPRLPVA